MWISKPTDLISKILSPALGLWLRSQVERVEELQLKIRGQDRQILRGYIPGVFVASRQAVYQGLHLSAVEIQGENIRINIGQVIKGKPLQLLEPIRVYGELRLEETDLQASLSSPILANAFNELLIALLELNEIANPVELLQKYQITWQNVTFNGDKFAIQGILTNAEGKISPIDLRSGLTLSNPHTLNLNPIYLEVLPELFTQKITQYQVDLGTDVELEVLNLTEGQLFCQGHCLIRP